MNTASAIRSAVAGRSERLQHRLYSATGLGEVFNDSNVHLSVKSSPEKTALALSPLAEKEGTVVKLNDSGSWRRRRALLVPHTFLYYFAESTAETDLRPHGVIDLLLYTDVEVVDETVVKLAPGDEMSPVRTFYLRMSSREEAQAWAQAIRETRFDCVRGERDALRAAKGCLTEQLVTQAEELQKCRLSLAASRRREAAALSEVARRNADEARRVEQVRALLAASASASASSASYGHLPDVDSSRSSSSSDGGGRRDYSVGAALSAASGGGERSYGNDGSRSSGLVQGGGPEVGAGGRAPMAVAVVGGRSSVAATALSELAALEEAIAERAQEVASLKMENAALREREALAVERRRKEVADALRLRDHERERADEEAALRSDLEVELQNLRAQLSESRAGWEEARTNLGVVAAACREADAKSRELQEHRRVLAREVKASRAEQRRLSAALSCATTAAATAASRAATARAEATAANAAAAAASETANSVGNRHRSSSAASWAAGDGCAARETALVGLGNGKDTRERGEGNNEAGEGPDGGRCGEGHDSNAEQVAEGGTQELPSTPPHIGEGGEDAEVQAIASETATVGDDDSVHGGGGGRGPGRCTAVGCDDGTGTAADAREGAVSLWVCPSSSDAVPGGLLQQQRRQEECKEVLVESGEEGLGTFPRESESAGGSDGVVSESDSAGRWGDADDGRGGVLVQRQQHVPSSCSSSSSSSSSSGSPEEGEGGSAQFCEGRALACSADVPSATEKLCTNVERCKSQGSGGGGWSEDIAETYDGARESGLGDRAEGGDKEGNVLEGRFLPPLSSPHADRQAETSIAGEDGSRSSHRIAALSPPPPPPPTATAEAPASPTTSLAAAFGESSSLRFNQMVQSLSAGLRESRKARRTPLLGSLDDDDDDDDGGGSGGGLCAEAADPDEDDGGVTDGTGTDGTGTDGGDSHHDSITSTTTATTAAMTRKDSGGAWSAWSMAGAGGGRGGGGASGRSRSSSCHEPSTTLADEGEQEEQKRGVVAAAVDAGEREDRSRFAALDGRNDFVGAALPSVPPLPTPTAEGSISGVTAAEFAPPPIPPSSPSTMLPASSAAAAAADAMATAAVQKTSEWLRVLGRPDGEEEGSETVEQGDPQIQERPEEVVTESRPVSLSPTKKEAEAVGALDGGVERCDGLVNGNGYASATATSASSTGSAVDADLDIEGGVGGAAVAVALAAAERGGRASAEAAAAARRWEAKLKGSLVSMAGGVRWGMGPQRITDANFFKS